jgi:hypothetical protein
VLFILQILSSVQTNVILIAKEIKYRRRTGISACVLHKEKPRGSNSKINDININVKYFPFVRYRIEKVKTFETLLHAVLQVMDAVVPGQGTDEAHSSTVCETMKHKFCGTNRT